MLKPCCGVVRVEWGPGAVFVFRCRSFTLAERGPLARLQFGPECVGRVGYGS